MPSKTRAPFLILHSFLWNVRQKVSEQELQMSRKKTFFYTATINIKITTRRACISLKTHSFCNPRRAETALERGKSWIRAQRCCRLAEWVHHSRVDFAHIFISVPTSKEDFGTQRVSAVRAPSAKQGSPFYSFFPSASREWVSVHARNRVGSHVPPKCVFWAAYNIYLACFASNKKARPFFSSSHQRPSTLRFQLFSAIDLGGVLSSIRPGSVLSSHPLGANNVYAGINHFFIPYTCTLDGSTRSKQREQHVHLVKGDALYIRLWLL